MSLKQRLLGAAVVIALVVIFVPMLLDGSGHKERVGMNMEIPPEPKYTFDPPPGISKVSKNLGIAEAEPSLAPQPAAPPPVVESRSTALPKSEPNKAMPESEPAGSKPQSSSQPHMAKAAPPEFAAVTEDESERKPGIGRGGESDAEAKEGWIVQVGSFSQRNNAAVLSDKLRAAGYEAFYERAGTGESTLYRVMIGPEPGLEEAEDLQARLLTERDLKGFVVSYP